MDSVSSLYDAASEQVPTPGVLFVWKCMNLTSPCTLFIRGTTSFKPRRDVNYQEVEAQVLEVTIIMND